MTRKAVDDRLRRLLLNRGFGPKPRLPSERELADDLGVSRPALREAMRRLVDLGIVQVRRGDGAYLSLIELVDLLEVRQSVEPTAARLAAERRTDEDVASMRAALDDLGANIDDPPAFAEADHRIHCLLAAASGNRVLSQVMAALEELTVFSRITTVDDRDLREATLADMSALVEHVANRRGGDAARCMRRHLKRVGRGIGTSGEANGE